MLQINDIHTYYGSSYILQGVSLDVEDSKIIGLLGRNGMGKTTLVHSVMGITIPRKGRIIYNNSEITGKRSSQIARKGISIVPQGRQIFPSLTVMENLTVFYRWKKDGWDVEKILELFPPLKERLNHGGSQLSGGEQQMLAIGRSLLTNPSLLLMDEPTEGLSPLFVNTVGNIIQKLKSEGMSILVVEQNLEFTLKYTEHVHILSQGKLVYSSSPQELETNHDIRSRYLGV